MSAPIVVAMSGGVDSSVAALLLSKGDVPVVGISMQVWDYRNNGGCKSRATCCAPDDFTDARVAASKMNIPYYVFDFEKSFRQNVIDKFVSSYQEGITPSPCIDCNQKVKFKELRVRAETFGASHVATGHYAQIEKRDDGYHLLRGADVDKDQSYFLYGLSQEELSKTLFPVGHMLKPDVRALAKEADLPTADKPESQDICFVSGKASDFVLKVGGFKKRAGNLVKSTGEVIGTHEGIHEFTVGQRKGIKIGGLDEPLYVLEIIPESNSVVVGSKNELEQESFIVTEVNYLDHSLSKIKNSGSIEAIVQVRSRHKGARVKVEALDEQRLKCTFISESAVIAPGQAAVFYDLTNTEVLGGGRILKIPLNLNMRAAA